jgi:cytoskeleton protein RodZ
MSEAASEARPAMIVGSGGVGPALRAARERRALSVGAVTEALHIEPRLIEAMEAGRFTVFDAPVYARGFIRKYGTFLELPVEDLIAAYDSLAGGPPAPSMIPITETAAPVRDFAPLKIGGAFVLLLLVVGGSYWWWMGRAPAPPPPPMDAAGAAPTAAPTAVPAARPAAEAVADTAAPRAAVVSERAAPRASSARAVASGAALVVTGLRECWVEVYAPSGARLLYDLVQAGDSRTLPGPGPWRVFLGNADGVRLSMGERVIAVPNGTRAGATARLVVTADGAVK